MFLRRYQWVLGIVWIVVAILILVREAVFPPAVLKHIKTENAPLIVLMAFVFAGWNFARWYAYINSRRPQSMENPLRSHHEHEVWETREQEPLIEFGFVNLNKPEPSDPCPSPDKSTDNG